MLNSNHKIIEFEFDPSEEYLFYPGPLSRQSSFDAVFQTTSSSAEDSKMNKALYDPNVRKQVAKLKPKRPHFLMFVTLVQIIVFVWSLVINFKRTGSFIQLTATATNPNPTPNYLIGPAMGVLIDMGARYIPCMKTNTGFDLPSDAYFVCPDGIFGSHGDGGCTLAELCSMDGLVANAAPNQWFRFLTAISLHGGLVHILMNMSFQVQGGFELEKDMGWWRMALIYFISGAGGFMFGASLSDITVPVVGASGSLYGMIACLFLDLLQNWTIIKKPYIELMKMTLNILFSLLIGTLPGVDNNSHVGGFVFGILSGLLLMPKIYYGKWDRRIKQFGMLMSIPLIAVLFGLLLNSFYTNYNFCPGCIYINCIPGLPWTVYKSCQASIFFNTTTLTLQ